MGAIGFVGLFLASLLFVPRINDYLSRREHHERMYKRTPFSPPPGAPRKLRRRRRRRKG
ncbi:MAG TPA: hypothetical protein VD906_07460 [Caulobacteraceae bacterium]|nr:hypothetical protein [Caulobacteraceae bacterium]